ncbi:MAG: DUF3071 domain-containing protein [Micropruina sp.]|nr:DUF3071 domain-containing protein [Micropruina sp.]
MRKARPLGLSADGLALIVVTDTGETIEVPADERLRAAIRDDRPRLGQLEIDMEPTLRPREIQQRIRAGVSLADVALAAGVPPERIEGFAAPVLAEREHVAGLAADAHVRKAGEHVAQRTLRAVVTERLLSRGIDPDSVDWDAWRNPDRLWSVTVSYASGTAHHQALFIYDAQGRFSTAANDDARWLVGDSTPSHGPQPGKRRHTQEEEVEGEEPTLDLSTQRDDQMAIIRAIQPVTTGRTTPRPGNLRPVPASETAAVEVEGEETEDAYAEGELAEVDGVYDIVSPKSSNLDVLYDMLASFDEDSVQIYSGLISPADAPLAGPPVLDEQAAPVEPEVPTTTVAPKPPKARAPKAAKPAPLPEPEQLSLLEAVTEEGPTEPTQPIAKTGKKRAHVPTWDEIMFGGPSRNNPQG